MKKWYQNLILHYPVLKFFGNRYILLTLAFAIWMLFLDNYSYLDQRNLNKQINELETNKAYYQQEIEKDKKNIQKLKNGNEIERYAREKYFMKRDSEDIYIIDIEEDRVKDSLKGAKN